MEQDTDQVTLKAILLFAELENKNILEIGCGDGRVTAMMVGRPASITAIDTNEESLISARETVTGVDFQTGSGECLKFPDKSFDVVIFTLSLHHQDSQIALEEAARVLKDEGRILVLEPLNDGEIEEICYYFHDERQELAKAEKAINESGLTIEDTNTFITKWVFENKDDLYKSLFEYYQMPFDSTIASHVAEYLGPKLESKPIIIQDKIAIFAFSKGQVDLHLNRT